MDQLVQPRTTAHLAADAVTTRLRADPQGATARSMTRVRHGGGCSPPPDRGPAVPDAGRRDYRTSFSDGAAIGLRILFRSGSRSVPIPWSRYLDACLRRPQRGATERWFRGGGVGGLCTLLA